MARYRSPCVVVVHGEEALVGALRVSRVVCAMSGKAHGSSFTLRGVVIPSAAGLATSPKGGGAGSVSSAGKGGSRPSSATKVGGRRDLQVVITSDGSRPNTAAGGGEGSGTRSSGALSRTNGRKVPVDPHADKHLNRPRRALDGALDAVHVRHHVDVMRPRPGTASMLYGVRQLRPATAPALSAASCAAPPPASFAGVDAVDAAALFPASPSQPHLGGQVSLAEGRPAHTGGGATLAEPSALFRGSSGALSLDRGTTVAYSLAGAGGASRDGLQFSKLTVARPVLASPHRRVQNPNPHRYDPSLAHFAPLQTYNTNRTPNHRSHLLKINNLRSTRNQNRIGSIMSSGHHSLKLTPTLAAPIPGKAVC